MIYNLAGKIRYQISLNTCQGCHSGENKTNFTHVYPRGFGEEANYWDATPSVVNINLYQGVSPFNPFANSIDDRFEVSGPTSPTLLANSGTTYQTYGGASHEKNLNFTEKTKNTVNQVVSPFLTGRKYSDKIANNWQDDRLNDVSELTLVNNVLADVDKSLIGLFYVNDPSNESSASGFSGGIGGPFPQIHTQQWGYNDLQRRQEDLCLFLSQSCTGPTIIHVMQHIFLIPLPLHSH
jgi:hypothetical protein